MSDHWDARSDSGQAMVYGALFLGLVSIPLFLALIPAALNGMTTQAAKTAVSAAALAAAGDNTVQPIVNAKGKVVANVITPNCTAAVTDAWHFLYSNLYGIFQNGGGLNGPAPNLAAVPQSPSSGVCQTGTTAFTVSVSPTTEDVTTFPTYGPQFTVTASLVLPSTAGAANRDFTVTGSGRQFWTSQSQM